MENEVKKPYKLKERELKEASYRNLIRPELADELYAKILKIMIGDRKYLDKDYSAKQLAVDLQTNPRYLSAVINSRYGDNYTTMVNEYRVRDAQHLLLDRRFKSMTMEEVGDAVGFSNRQSFYSAFYKFKGVSPRRFREQHGK